jgi:hypothetical protein
VTDHRIGDAPHEGPSYPSQSPAAHCYQAGTYLFGQLHDTSVWPSSGPEVSLSDPEVGLRDCSPCLLDLLNLPIEYLSSLPLDLSKRFFP